MTTPPGIARALFRALLHAAERDEVVEDMIAEYAHRSRNDGALRARVWLWRQVLGSVPGAVRRGWHRGTTGFESEANRMTGGGAGLESWIMDARFALRGLRRRPQYVLLAVLTLALGIGGTTAVFGIARAVLFSPLPYAQPEELVMFWNPHDWSESEVAYLRPEWPGFAGVAAYTMEGVFLRQPGRPAQVIAGIASSAELFTVLGTRPLLGRAFEPGDDVAGAMPKAILSHGLWQELGGRPEIVGTTLVLDGAVREVSGVMPEGFWFPDPSVRVWLSTPMRADARSGRYALVGRLEPGRAVAAMADPLRRITTRLSEQFTYPEQYDKTRNAELTPITDYVAGPVRPALLATLAGMAMILLMACANVATLMLGQLRGRESEFALRVAIGAGRRRIAQQLLVEATMLALVAGLVGAVVALLGFRALVAALPLGELAQAVAADWTLFATAMTVAFGAALLIALAPVLSLWRGDLRDALDRARSGGIGARGGRLEDMLVIGEVALAVLLAAGAAVLIRSVANLRAIDPGVETANIGVIDVTSSADVAPALRREQVGQLIAALRDVPGVRSAAAVQQLPLRDHGHNWGIQIQSRPELPPTTTAMRMVTLDYFDVMGIVLRSGRLFDNTDRIGGEPVVIIDENLAAKYFPGEDPIGQFVESGVGQGWMRVIGVVESVAHAGLTAEPVAGRYVLIDQFAYTPDAFALVLQLEPRASTGTVLQAAVRGIEQTVATFAVNDATTMDNILAVSMGATRRIMQLMTMLGGLALVLGAIGVYGVVSQFVNRRRRDWVIRMALGMRPGDALAQVVGRGATLVAIGCAIGLVAAVALTRLFTSLLYEVDAADPRALAAAAAALILTGCIAALVPAVRASRANPAQVLRDAA